MSIGSWASDIRELLERSRSAREVRKWSPVVLTCEWEAGWQAEAGEAAPFALRAALGTKRPRVARALGLPLPHDLGSLDPASSHRQPHLISNQQEGAAACGAGPVASGWGGGPSSLASATPLSTLPPSTPKAHSDSPPGSLCSQGVP